LHEIGADKGIILKWTF